MLSNLHYSRECLASFVYVVVNNTIYADKLSSNYHAAGLILRNFSGCTIFQGPPLPSFPLPLSLLRSKSLRSRAP